MQKLKTTPWYIVYHQIALELHKFYVKNGNKSGQLLFKLVNSSTIFRKHNKWLSNMNRIKNASIDPIQLFVSFSRSRQNEIFRKEIINEICELLYVAKNWEEINFEGCPAPIALKLQYIRPENVQAKIWQTFSSVMKNNTKVLTELIWKEAKTWRGIGIPSFTIFLFWIHSKYFLPLDKNTRQYLEQIGLLKTTSDLKYEVYKGLLSNKTIDSYTKLSLEAYYFINYPKIFKEKFKKGSIIQEKEIVNTSFKLIGLRTLNSSIDLHKILKNNKYYPLDYSITPDDDIKQNNNHLIRFNFEDTVKDSIYNLENLKINITAIVGKNGSGKSTLLDLLLMGIYNLSIKLGYLDTECKCLNELNFEVYWLTDTLYKLVFTKDILFYGFRQITNADGTKAFELINEPKKFNELTESFFYTILVNYSHYALNSRDHKIDWITPLSHKNDGYLTPLVINPMRTDGNIDINRERGLLNMRLLVNLLELHDADIPHQSFRYIDNGKYIKYFSISFDENKQREKKQEADRHIYEDSKIVRMVMNCINEVFGLKVENKVSTKYNTSVEYYIVNKLFTITSRYKQFSDKYKEGLNNLVKYNIASMIEAMDFELEMALNNLIKNLLNDIKDSKSHITLKLIQAINYLKYPALRKFLNAAIENRSLIDLDKYKLLIDKIISDEQEYDLTVPELLPPAIFKLDFYLEDFNKSSLSKASSGEYQLVSVLSSILYHLRNIDSNNGENRYNYITVLLDEIELYFHPNMQRLFIRKLLEALDKLENDFYGIHILFATHSPFILSDIQQQKILKLRNGEVEKNVDAYNTFAANMHDLLADDFFLEEGYMGAFAQKEIEQAINILNYIISENELINVSLNTKQIPVKVLNALKQKYDSEKSLFVERLRMLGYWNEKRTPENWNKETVKQQIVELIEMIGEPLIKEKLTKMFNTAYEDNSLNITSRRDKVKNKILRLMSENKIDYKELQ